jgi:hypothetical protein
MVRFAPLGFLLGEMNLAFSGINERVRIEDKEKRNEILHVEERSQKRSKPL